MFKCTVWVEETPLRKVHVPDSNLMINMTMDDKKRGEKCKVGLTCNKLRLIVSQELLVKSSPDLCIFGLFTFNFYLLDYVLSVSPAFKTLLVLDAPSFEQNKVTF